MNTIHQSISKFLVSLTLLGGLTAINQPAQADTITGESGNVRAEISFEKPEEFQYKNVRLQIKRAGKTVLNQNLPQESEYDRPIGGLFTDKLPVLDLDGNKEPEVMADFFTGGAHCCTYSLIYRYNSKSQQYQKIRHDWGNGGYQLKDLDKDGKPEFISRDDRFAYAFTSYAASGYPIQIWQYRQGKMIDVTRRYPKEVASHAAEVWKTYTEIRQQGEDEGKGFLAAYLADKYLLGQGQDGWRRVQQAYKKSDRNQYFTELRKFLRETGYTRSGVK
ncbi:hypothetical protein ACQFX9_00305 [Aliinostoc sp. HNIBRCY26]|uniref:hypothetical protein n=1 Tax=Aliinostoc sp. HNIBRCY26 TaxID=3418997 RepID=UPI003D062076